MACCFLPKLQRTSNIRSLNSGIYIQYVIPFLRTTGSTPPAPFKKPPDVFGGAKVQILFYPHQTFSELFSKTFSATPGFPFSGVQNYKEFPAPPKYSDTFLRTF
jgi:hypothetical protein